MTVISGEMDVSYLFVKERQLNWSYHMYRYENIQTDLGKYLKTNFKKLNSYFVMPSYYTGARFGLSTLTLLAFSPLARYWNLSDGLFAMIGLVSRIAGLVLLGLATTTTGVFLAPVISLFSSFTVAALRAMLSKLVDRNELGQLVRLH